MEVNEMLMLLIKLKWYELLRKVYFMIGHKLYDLEHDKRIYESDLYWPVSNMCGKYLSKALNVQNTYFELEQDYITAMVA